MKSVVLDGHHIGHADTKSQAGIELADWVLDQYRDRIPAELRGDVRRFHYALGLYLKEHGRRALALREAPDAFVLETKDQ